MSWKHVGVEEQRRALVERWRKRFGSFAAVCAEFGVSRKTGYKWVARQAAGGWPGLEERRSGPRVAKRPQAKRWRPLAEGVRRAHPSWGGQKIRDYLGRKHGRRNLPSARSIARWLAASGLVRGPRRTRRGPGVPHPGLTHAQRCHQVWTVDFKGWYRTQDGVRQEPLTVRDLHSRYLLAIRLLPKQSDGGVRKVFAGLFQREGLPQAIRVDNGAPFGGKGALGLSRLSVWWLRLGIRVEYMRRARPGDNAGHEQMHGVYAAEVAEQAGKNREAEQRRAERWRKLYNTERPHAALGSRTPGEVYRPNRRRAGATTPAWVYPGSWQVRRVRPHGDIKWEGRLRFIGRAFVGERVGVRASGAGRWKVYLGKLCVGELWEKEGASMRPAQWKRGKRARSSDAAET